MDLTIYNESMEQPKENYAFISYKREDEKETMRLQMPWNVIACQIICGRRLQSCLGVCGLYSVI